ncbi:MAG: Rne/Rng family ribonuclease [Armatimonadota bacterium]
MDEELRSAGEPGGNGDNGADSTESGRRRRRPRRRKDSPTPDVVSDETVEGNGRAPAEISAAAVPPASGEFEVVQAGEPIPLLQRDPVFQEATGRGEDVLVPEAFEEEALAPFPERAGGGESRRAGGELPLPPFTPELLARFREGAGEETPRPRKQRGRPQPAAAAEEPVPLPAPEPVPVLSPLIVVAEALLETAPEEPVEEPMVLRLPTLAPAEDEEQTGRRRRRRGRDRREGPEETSTPAVAAEAPAAEAPARERERGRDRRDRERDRDREPERETRKEERADHEYKEILVNVEDRETRIAVLENGRLMELHVEREERVVGNIYKARVANVLPGMDAAFVDIGLERNAFLYVGDILFEDPKAKGDHPTRRTSRDVRISDLAKPGQEILVQVVKGPRGTKGARVSTKISIPGRYLVLMPEGDHTGVSRKIDDVKERDRLRRLCEQLQPAGFGLIVRTEAEGRSEQELRQDLEYLVNTWRRVSEQNKRSHAPAVLHKDLGIILKTIRDLFGADTDKLIIDSRDEYDKAIDTLSQLAPDLVDRVHLHDEPTPLFSRYNLEDEIERLLRRKVWLRNGAYLLLDTTEALTTIDVNTGKFVGTSSLAETILKTNLDAVDEIARQLRLRDIGGMIVLDFIDMASARDRQLVMKALENAFKKDRTRIKIAHISPLGLVEMTRKRTAESVTDAMSHQCPYCQGRGRVWSPETMAIQIEREIRRLAAKQELDAVLVYCNPEVAAWMIGSEGDDVEQLERLIRKPVYVRARHDFHTEKFEVLPADMLEMERQVLPYHGGQVVDCYVTKIDLITPPRSAAWVDGYFVDLANGVRYQGQTVRVRLTDVRRSFAMGEPVAPSTAVDRTEPI